MVSAALRAVGNIVTGDDIQTQVVYLTNLIYELCVYPFDEIMKRKLWIPRQVLNSPYLRYRQ